MSRAEYYEDFAEIFSYPWSREPLEYAVARLLDRGVALQDLASFLATATLGTVQEEFVAAFDLDQRCAPYAGHHLYGEHRLRADYLIRLKEMYRWHAFEGTAGEPPDHLPTMFRFAAHLAREDGKDSAVAFIAEYLLDGVRRLREAAEGRDFAWKGAVAAATTLCVADAQEVT